MREPECPDAARLRISLHDLDPAPWRLVEVPLSMTFTALHQTIQAAFQWFDMHLWEFDYDGRRVGPPFDDDDDLRSADNARLTKLRDGKVREFLYTYDFGDTWEHRIEVLELFSMPTGARLPRLIAGEGRCPPEDIGGPPGFARFLEALADPADPDHAEMVEWSGGGFDPEDIDREQVDVQLLRLARKRRPKR